MTDDQKLRARTEAFVVMMRKMYKRLGEELEVIEAALAAEASPAQIARVLFLSYCEKWKIKHKGETFIVGGEGGKYIGMLKRLLTGKTPLSQAEVERRMAIYFSSRAPYYVESKFPLGVFVKNINEFNGPRVVDAGEFLQAPAPGDCRHTPRCKSDIEHTERKRKDLRGER